MCVTPGAARPRAAAGGRPRRRRPGPDPGSSPAVAGRPSSRRSQAACVSAGSETVRSASSSRTVPSDAGPQAVVQAPPDSGRPSTRRPRSTPRPGRAGRRPRGGCPSTRAGADAGRRSRRVPGPARPRVSGEARGHGLDVRRERLGVGGVDAERERAAQRRVVGERVDQRVHDRPPGEHVDADGQVGADLALRGGRVQVAAREVEHVARARGPRRSAGPRWRGRRRRPRGRSRAGSAAGPRARGRGRASASAGHLEDEDVVDVVVGGEALRRRGRDVGVGLRGVPELGGELGRRGRSRAPTCRCTPCSTTVCPSANSAATRSCCTWSDTSAPDAALAGEVARVDHGALLGDPQERGAQPAPRQQLVDGAEVEQVAERLGLLALGVLREVGGAREPGLAGPGCAGEVVEVAGDDRRSAGRIVRPPGVRVTAAIRRGIGRGGHALSGPAVGTAVGAATAGATVGRAVGAAVGATVGAAVRATVGTAAGRSAVGRAVAGAAVGATVGAAVGRRCRPHRRRRGRGRRRRRHRRRRRPRHRRHRGRPRRRRPGRGRRRRRHRRRRRRRRRCRPLRRRPDRALVVMSSSFTSHS